MKICFFGAGSFAAPAVRALAAKNEIAAVFTHPPRLSGRGGKRSPTPAAAAAVELNLPVREIQKPPEAMEFLRASGAPLAVVCDFGALLPRALLRIPRLGFLNIHASLLPRWRGAAPVARAILAGDEKTGVSIMQTDSGLDTGPVLLQQEVDIAPRENGGALLKRLADIGGALAARAVDELSDLVPAPQKESLATFAPKITAADRALNFAQPAAQVCRQVRAFAPAPGAFAFCGEMRIKILEAEAASPSTEVKTGAAGEIVKSGGGELIVACAEGALAVRALQKAGGAPLSVEEFLRGTPLPAGARFAAAPESAQSE